MNITQSRFLLIFTLLIAGCTANADDARGAWIQTTQRAKTTLVISETTMTTSNGILTITAKYSIVKKEGRTMVVKLFVDGYDRGDLTLELSNGGKTLSISESMIFGGEWTRK